MSDKIEGEAKCSCGHEFVVSWEQFRVDSSECDCCRVIGVTYTLEITCPGCKRTSILREDS